MTLALLGILLVFIALPVRAEETVFLLHGMGRTRISMTVLAMRFRRAGYRVVNLPYGTVQDGLDEITAKTLKRIGAETGGGRYHLVGHSLGNVIIRNGFKTGYPPGLGRIVMLAPPNRPALLAGAFRDNPLYRWRTGEAGQSLADEKFYENLPVPAVPFGVIAGTRGLPFFFHEPNDGVLRVGATRLPGMDDFKEVGHSHTFLMNARDPFEDAERFLRTGSFTGGKARGDPRRP